MELTLSGSKSICVDNCIIISVLAIILKRLLQTTTTTKIRVIKIITIKNIKITTT